MRLIDADAFRDWWLYNGENEHIYDTNDVLDSIDSMPTITLSKRVICSEEVKEAWRGEWKENKNAVIESAICSKCKTVFQAYYGNYQFCPVCGAPMTDKAVQMVMEKLGIERLEEMREGPINADAFRNWRLYNEENEHIYNTDDILDSIVNWPLITSPNEWVSVEERLPEKKQDVLMLFEGGNMAVGWWYDSDEYITFWCAYTDDGFYTNCDDIPIYWMPLPKPPTEEEVNGRMLSM